MVVYQLLATINSQSGAAGFRQIQSVPELLTAD